MNTVSIGGKDSYKDYGCYLKSKEIGLPEPKTSFVTPQGSNGSIDLSTALTDGNMLYGDRLINLELCFVGFGAEHNRLVDEFVSDVHGRRHEFIFSDDKEYYYSGLWSVTEREENHGYTIVRCEITAEPYRYSFDTTVISKTVISQSILRVYNSRMWTIPTITSDAEMTLLYQGETYPVHEGMQINEDIILRDGTNILAFIGDGTVTIEYQQGVI